MNSFIWVFILNMFALMFFCASFNLAKISLSNFVYDESHAFFCRFNRSGVLCSMFCRCFEGVDLTPKLQEVVLFVYFTYYTFFFHDLF